MKIKKDFGFEIAGYFTILVAFITNVILQFAYNLEQFKIVVSFFAAYSTVLFIHFLLYQIYPHSKKIFLIFSIWLICILFFFEINGLINLVSPILIRNRYIVILCILLATIITVTIIKSNRIFFSISKYIVYLTITIALTNIYNYFSSDVTETIINQKTDDGKKHPDIYLILLDMYANPSVLKNYLNFDDSYFIDSLKSKGFYYAENSKSNYTRTIQTMSSMLNLNYNAKIYNLDNEYIKLIKSNNVVKILEENHYDIENLSLFNLGKHATKFPTVDFFGTDNFYYFLVQKSLIGYFYSLLKKNDITKEGRLFEKAKSIVSEIPLKPHPQFVYLHSTITHYPFYLNDSLVYSKENENANLSKFDILKFGDNKQENDTSGDAKKDSLFFKTYTNHVRMANKYSLELVDQILKISNRNSIIILMSDHGFPLLNINTPPDKRQAAKYQNFCALYYPDQDYSSLYSTITPINVMRLTLNKAKISKFSRLPDSTGIKGNL